MARALTTTEDVPIEERPVYHRAAVRSTPAADGP